MKYRPKTLRIASSAPIVLKTPLDHVGIPVREFYFIRNDWRKIPITLIQSRLSNVEPFVPHPTWLRSAVPKAIPF